MLNGKKPVKICNVSNELKSCLDIGTKKADFQSSVLHPVAGYMNLLVLDKKVDIHR